MKMALKNLAVGVGVLSLMFCFAVPTQSGELKGRPTKIKPIGQKVEMDPEGTCGIYARIDTIRGSNLFETTQYRYKDLSVHTWRLAGARIEGADTSQLVNGEYFHGLVRDIGIYTDPSSKTQWRRYQVVKVFAHK